MTEHFYNGWPSRETWAMHLHLTNDEHLYMTVEAMAARACDLYSLADDLRGLVDDWWQQVLRGESIPAAILMLLNEAGSTWRVDWIRIAEAFMEP